MGLRRYVKHGEQELFLGAFIVLCGLGVYLTLMKDSAPQGEPAPSLAVAQTPLDKLWLEASLNKGDLRPVAEGLAEDPQGDSTALASDFRPPAPPTPAADSAAAEETAPARSFPLAAEPEPEPIEQPRIAPMAESLMGHTGSGNTSSAFMAIPPRVKPALPPSTGSAGVAAPTRPAPPPKRTWRSLSGN